MQTKILLPLFVAAAVLTGCGDNQTAITGEGQTLVSVNGVDLKESLVTPQLAGIPAQLLAGRQNEIMQQLVGQLVDQEVARQEAERLDVMSGDNYKEQLARFEKQLKINTLMQNKISEAVTDEAVAGAYEQAKESFAYPAVRARHILVKTEKEARDIIRVATPKNFAELAKEKSQGPSAPQGGDLGYFKKENMVPEFAEVAFSTAKGKIARKPVKTQFGWHVVYVEDTQDKYIPPLAEVAQQLRQRLSQTVLQGYVQELKGKATIVYPKAEEAKEAMAKENMAKDAK